MSEKPNKKARGRPRELDKPVHVGFQVEAADLDVLQSMADQWGYSLSGLLRSILADAVDIERQQREGESKRDRAAREHRIAEAAKAREARVLELEARAARMREREAARRARRGQP